MKDEYLYSIFIQEIPATPHKGYFHIVWISSLINLVLFIFSFSKSKAGSDVSIQFASQFQPL
jgi:hypothetical protein